MKSCCIRGPDITLLTEEVFLTVPLN